MHAPQDFNANDVGYVPSNAPHYIENTGDTDLVFLETFATDEFQDVSLNQWLRRVPSEMLKAHLNIDKEHGYQDSCREAGSHLGAMGMGRSLSAWALDRKDSRTQNETRITL